MIKESKSNWVLIVCFCIRNVLGWTWTQLELQTLPRHMHCFRFSWRACFPFLQQHRQNQQSWPNFNILINTTCGWSSSSSPTSLAWGLGQIILVLYTWLRDCCVSTELSLLKLNKHTQQTQENTGIHLESPHDECKSNIHSPFSSVLVSTNSRKKYLGLQMLYGQISSTASR